jgi:threonine/homoserine/homoserine lactone efflux protein
MTAFLLQGISFGYAAGMTPGPLQAFLFMQTLQRGWQQAIWLVLSPLISDAPVVALILFVLRGASEPLLRVIGFAGGVFVLYIAWGLFKQIRSGEFERAVVAGQIDSGSLPQANTTFTMLRKAVGINLLGPIVIDAWRDSPPSAVIFVAGFYATFLAVMATQVLLFHQARRFGPKVVRYALWFALVAMLLFAVRLWWNALVG